MAVIVINAEKLTSKSYAVNEVKQALASKEPQDPDQAAIEVPAFRMASDTSPKFARF